jgi:hypothetical protein
MRAKAAVVLLLALLTGCGGTKQFVRAYPGAELPLEQLALVKPVIGIDVVSVDGNKAYGVRTARSTGYADVDMELTPGRHIFVVFMRTGSAYSLGTVTIALDAEAGHKYIINGSPDSPSRFKPIFEDVTANPDRYCAQAGASDFKGCSKVWFK